ncbi:hypothetical protein ACF1FX_19100 [Streptomyces sp. NPDC014646]|uniref:hypothetical protein n=1 Tax=unclassified Streptomyces TaxID=2593676 RepID=UPI0036F4E7D8
MGEPGGARGESEEVIHGCSVTCEIPQGSVVTDTDGPAVGSVGETLTVKLLDLTPGTTATVEVTLRYPDFVSTHDIGDLDEAFDEVMALESGQCRSRRTVEQFAAHAEPDHAPGRQLVSAYSTLLGVTE